MKMPFFLAAYTLVLFSEFLDSEALYTISTLASRFPPLPVLCGSTIAFAGKMLVAVLLGGLVGKLPPSVVDAASACTFFTMALVVWFKKPEVASSIQRDSSSGYWVRAVLISFTSIFGSEWGDLEQITAATLAANYHEPAVVWLGATLALVTKALLAVMLGAALKKRIPQSLARYGGICVFAILGIAAALRFIREVR